MLQHFVNGTETASANGRHGDIYNPATGEVQKKVAFASKADVENAIAAAQEAFPAWAATPPGLRAKILFKYKHLLDENADKIAELLTSEHGKVLNDAKGEVIRGIEVVEFACGIPHLLKGEYTENVARNVDSWSMRQPLGVVAGITPFNFPAMVPLWMYPIAIACGNTFVLKPSEKDPGAPLFCARLLKEAGLPDGVLNIVNGDKEAVDTLLTDSRIQAVSFVGSTEIGEYIYKTGCANGKRVQALCGAKNHMVVMPDADIDQAVDALMGSAFGSAGERCMAIPVALLVGDVADPVMNKLKSRVNEMKVGPGTNPDSEMGPLVTPQHHAKVRSYIDLGVEEGATLAVDGRSLKVEGHENGCFLGGTVFDNVTPDMRIYKEEIFGPVLSVVRVPDFETAIKLVNDHEYGNGTGIFTRDGDAARTYASRVQVGMVGINVPIPVPMAYHSFGGWKRSLFGDHHMHGPEGVRFFTRQKTITSRWPTGIRAGAQYNFPTVK